MGVVFLPNLLNLPQYTANALIPAFNIFSEGNKKAKATCSFFARLDYINTKANHRFVFPGYPASHYKIHHRAVQ
jgi:hypothetical protein